MKFLSRFTILTTLALLLVLIASCAGDPDAETTVMEQNKIRSYERFKKDHAAVEESEINKAGIHVYGRHIYVVISLSDSGSDRYPEWAADKLLTTLYGYRVADRQMVSDDEFYELVLKFSLDSIVEGKYENLARIRILEKDVQSFVELHNK